MNIIHTTNDVNANDKLVCTLLIDTGQLMLCVWHVQLFTEVKNQLNKSISAAGKEGNWSGSVSYPSTVHVK